MKKFLATYLLMIACFFSHAQDQYREKVFVHTDKVFYHAGETMWMKVYVAKAGTNKPSSLSRVVYVQLVDSSGTRVARGVFSVQDGAAKGSFELPLTLKPSVYRLISYTRWMRNFPEEDFFSTGISVDNGYLSYASYIADPPTSTLPAKGDLGLTIHLNATAFDKRSKVELHISTKTKQQPVPAKLSVSVYRLNMKSESAVQSVSKHLTHITGNPDFHFRYAPEVRGQWITGKVINRFDKSAGRNVDVYLSVPGRTSGFHHTRSDSAGNFKIEMNATYAADSIVLLTNPVIADSVYTLQLDDPFVNVAAWRTSSAFTRASNRAIVSDARNAIEVQRSFQTSQPESFYAENRVDNTFYGHHDLWYNLDDYTRFPKMEEVFREYIQMVSVNKRGGRYHLNVYNEPYKRMFDSDPLVLLDGYPVFDINRLFQFDPLKVEAVSVVTRRYFHGSSVFDGIVVLDTYTKNLNSFVLDKNAVVLHDKIVGKTKKFVAPQYVAEADRRSRIPDFRTVLFWEPDAVADSSGNCGLEFFTGDLEGNFLIEVQGITNSGESGSATMLFTVNAGSLRKQPTGLSFNTNQIKVSKAAQN